MCKKTLGKGSKKTKEKLFQNKRKKQTRRKKNKEKRNRMSEYLC